MRVLPDRKSREITPTVLNRFGDNGAADMWTLGGIIRHFALREAADMRAATNIKISLRRPVDVDGLSNAVNKMADAPFLAPRRYDAFADKERRLPPRDCAISPDLQMSIDSLRITRSDG